jgi:hypothetical protein
MVPHEKAERILPGDKSLVIIHQDRSDTAARCHFYCNPAERLPAIARG